MKLFNWVPPLVHFGWTKIAIVTRPTNECLLITFSHWHADANEGNEADITPRSFSPVKTRADSCAPQFTRLVVRFAFFFKMCNSNSSGGQVLPYSRRWSQELSEWEARRTSGFKCQLFKRKCSQFTYFYSQLNPLDFESMQVCCAAKIYGQVIQLLGALNRLKYANDMHISKSLAAGYFDRRRNRKIQIGPRRTGWRWESVKKKSGDVTLVNTWCCETVAKSKKVRPRTPSLHLPKKQWHNGRCSPRLGHRSLQLGRASQNFPEIRFPCRCKCVAVRVLFNVNGPHQIFFIKFLI